MDEVVLLTAERAWAGFIHDCEDSLKTQLR